MAYRAIMAGATGAVGSSVVRELLQSVQCTGVVALTRRAFDGFRRAPGNEKLRVEVIDFADLENATVAHASDVAFCTVGIGQPRKVSDEEFRRVDIEYAGAFARGSARAGCRHISLLSSIGANANSSNRYIRVKGEAEQAVIGAGIARTSIFRPSLLATPEIRYGLQDRLTQSLFPIVTPLLPRRLHDIRVEALARAMRVNAEVPGAPGVEHLYYPDFVRLIRRAGESNQTD